MLKRNQFSHSKKSQRQICNSAKINLRQSSFCRRNKKIQIRHLYKIEKIRKVRLNKTNKTNR